MEPADFDEDVSDPTTEPFSTLTVGYMSSVRVVERLRCRCGVSPATRGTCPCVMNGVVSTCVCCKGCRNTCARDA